MSSRKDAVLAWVLFWSVIAYFVVLFIWPLIFGPLLLAGLFFGSLYLAIFEWPGSEP